jgi:hypothetical protein
MFERLLEIVKLDIATVRAIIQTNNKLRSTIFSQDNLNQQELEHSSEFSSLLKIVPNDIEWQVYDSCAAVTRLYAIYESFVENLIEEWIRLLPKIVSNYSELGEKIQNTHREGTARLLLDLNKKGLLKLKQLLYL